MRRLDEIPAERAYVHEILVFTRSFEAKLPQDYAPEDPAVFGARVWLLLGSSPLREQGADRFDCLVCTPRWFADHYPTGTNEAGVGDPEAPGVVSGNGIIFIDAWSPDRFEQAIEAICDRCRGHTWGAVASRIARDLLWEYDYRYDQQIDELGVRRPQR